jgi:hypothetical protein
MRDQPSRGGCVRSSSPVLLCALLVLALLVLRSNFNPSEVDRAARLRNSLRDFVAKFLRTPRVGGVAHVKSRGVSGNALVWPAIGRAEAVEGFRPVGLYRTVFI